MKCLHALHFPNSQKPEVFEDFGVEGNFQFLEQQKFSIFACPENL
jgi:hypothetical protein